MVGSNAGAVVEGVMTGTGKDVSDVGWRVRAGAGLPPAKRRRQSESPNCAGADGPAAKGRSVGSWAKRELAKQQAAVRGDAHCRRKNPTAG